VRLTDSAVGAFDGGHANALSGPGAEARVCI
jgi:hypothetical protein